MESLFLRIERLGNFTIYKMAPETEVRTRLWGSYEDTSLWDHPSSLLRQGFVFPRSRQSCQVTWLAPASAPWSPKDIKSPIHYNQCPLDLVDFWRLHKLPYSSPSPTLMTRRFYMGRCGPQPEELSAVVSFLSIFAMLGQSKPPFANHSKTCNCLISS